MSTIRFFKMLHAAQNSHQLKLNKCIHNVSATYASCMSNHTQHCYAFSKFAWFTWSTHNTCALFIPASFDSLHCTICYTFTLYLVVYNSG